MAAKLPDLRADRAVPPPPRRNFPVICHAVRNCEMQYRGRICFTLYVRGTSGIECSWTDFIGVVATSVPVNYTSL
jgi:hypothetical protein